MTSLPHDLAGRILDGSPDAVLVCDRTGTVRYWNIAAERVFGFGATEAIGVSMDLIIPTGPRPSNFLAEALLTEVEFLLSFDIEFVRWMDDQVVFGNTEEEVVTALHRLGARLNQTEGFEP